MADYKMSPEEILAYIATVCNQEEFCNAYLCMECEVNPADRTEFIEQVWHEIGKGYAEEGRDCLRMKNLGI